MVGAGIRTLEPLSVAASDAISQCLRWWVLLVYRPVPAICRLGLRLGSSQLRRGLAPRGRRQPEQGSFQKVLVRTGESSGKSPKGKGKAPGVSLPTGCHRDLDWLAESPVRDPREMVRGYRRLVWCNVSNVPTTVTPIGT